MSLPLPFVLRQFAIACLCIVLGHGAALGQDDPSAFQIEALNPGLPEGSDHVDLRTPHAALSTLIDAVDEDRLLDGAHALDLADIPEDRQLELGQDLARKLVVVLDRRVVVPWADLLQRPDGLDANASRNSAVAGQARQSILLATVDGAKRAVAIRLERVAPQDGAPVWVVSRETVAQIPALFDIYGPTAFEDALPDWLRQDALFGLYLWELVALPILIWLAWITGRALFALFARLSARADRYWTTLALSALRWPSVIAAVTTLLLLSTGWVFVFSGPITTVLGPLIVIGYVAAAMLFGLNVIDAALRRFVTFEMSELSEHDQVDNRSLATGLTAARRVVVVLGMAVAVGFILSSARLYNTLGLSLLASAGAVTLILGFAARRVLGNMLASLQIAINRSARIGDQIEYDGHWCTVERIHFTFVQLKVWNNDRLIVPVEHFVSDNFINYTLTDARQIRTIQMTLAQTADLDALRDAFRDLAASEHDVADPGEAQMVVLSQDAFGLVVRFQFPATNPNTGWIAECRLREALMKEAQRIEDDSGTPMLPRASRDDLPDVG